MEILLDKKDQSNATIKVNLKETDYLPVVNEKLKEYGKKANLKGFRPGKVPPALIQKMYGKSIKVDEINNLLAKTVTNYIKENKINIIGDPIPDTDKAANIDWDTQKEFEFDYNVGLIPDFKFELSDKVKITKYNIIVTDAIVKETLGNLQSQYGQMVDAESVSEGDFINGELKSADGTFTTNTIVPLNRVVKANQKNFLGKKVGDKVSFEIEKTFEDSAAVAYVTGLTKEEAETKKGIFELNITGIRRSENAVLNQEFFDKIFGKDTVTTEEEFLKKLESTIQENYVRETDHMLIRDIRTQFVKNTAISLPEDFLKKWLLLTNKEITSEQVEKDFALYTEDLKWNIIKNRIAEENDVKVENEEIVNKTKEMVKGQFGGMNFGEEMEDTLNKITDTYLKQENGRTYMRMFENVLNEKITDVIKSKVSIQDKNVSLEEFKKLAETVE